MTKQAIPCDTRPANGEILTSKKTITSKGYDSIHILIINELSKFLAHSMRLS